MTKQGWFTTFGRPGDRTLGSQKIGLERLYGAVRGKTLLDIGCAEGLLTMDLVSAGGAVAAHGVEIVKEHIEVANNLNAAMRDMLPVCFEVGDANTWTPKRQYDVVTLLAVLHKLKNPTAACARFAAVARELVVIRLPPLHAPTIIDERSGNNPHHIGKVMEANGWWLDEVAKGPFDEWCGYYVRTNP